MTVLWSTFLLSIKLVSLDIVLFHAVICILDFYTFNFIFMTSRNYLRQPSLELHLFCFHGPVQPKLYFPRHFIHRLRISPLVF